jgi:hypothetical protein
VDLHHAQIAREQLQIIRIESGRACEGEGVHLW